MSLDFRGQSEKAESESLNCSERRREDPAAPLFRLEVAGRRPADDACRFMMKAKNYGPDVPHASRHQS
jgi:hypothetical protein